MKKFNDYFECAICDTKTLYDESPEMICKKCKKITPIKKTLIRG